ncbi:MAG TPA: RNA 2',3'-cyclic phosphodiesterase [Micromonosporaceae bacterium]|nr:RNA 2',3'-cyclic phosphodiesterase [Micromonosporaceae bacterium]
MRLFVAAYPSAAALDDLADQVSTMHVGRAAAAGVNARVTARPLWHLTLAFLGDVANDRCDDVVGAIEAAAERFDGQRPMVRLAGGGTFGRGRFALLWVGADGDVAGLGSLAGTVRAELRRARLPFDRKPFRAHLTIARPGDRIPGSDLADDVAHLSTYQGPWWTLTEITLVESHLGPHPRHDPLSVRELG